MLKKLNRPILAEGEVTGHAHIVDADIEVFLNDETNAREFVTNKSVTIKHEEHNPITIPEGNWISDKINEYDHFLEESKKVID